MGEHRYFRPRNWERWQNFQRAHPSYIRNHLALLRDTEYLQLSERAALALHRLWMLTAANSGPIPLDFRLVSRQINMSCRGFKIAFEELLSSNFIELCDLSWKPYAGGRDRQRQSKETDTSTSVDVTPPVSPPTPASLPLEELPPTAVKPPKPNGRGTRLNADWFPSERDREFAAAEGMTAEEIDREADRFRDYWLGVAGQRGTKRDWGATWRNWVRRSADQQRQGGGAVNGSRQPQGRDRGTGSWTEAAEWVIARTKDPGVHQG